jgi:hypothetical protein
MGFDPFNRSLKIQKSIRIPTLKVGIHLGVWGFNSHTIPYSQPHGSMNVIPGLHSWPATLQVFALVASPRLGLRHVMW